MTVTEAIQEKRAKANALQAESLRLQQQGDWDAALDSLDDAIKEIRYIALLAAGEAVRTRQPGASSPTPQAYPGGRWKMGAL